MPYVASIGTYLPCWGAPQHRVAGDDEDVITLAVEAGRAALIASGAVERVVLVSRDLPLLESSNAAVLLAGLGLDPELEVDERLGGAPATLDAVSSARPRTLIIGTDLNPAGAAAILTAERGLQVRTAARVTRSLPVRTRKATGAVHDYGDPRLLHERGLVASLAAAWLDTPAAVAGVEHDRAVELCIGDPPSLPTSGASASLFALAGMADAGTTGISGSMADEIKVTAGATGNVSATSTVSARVYGHQAAFKVDNVNPSVTMSDPGSPVTGTITLQTSAASDTDSYVAQVQFQRSPAGAGSWTNVGSADTTSPYSVSFDTTTVGDGLYDFRAVATDGAGNAANSATISNRRIDNTAPSSTTTFPASSGSYNASGWNAGCGTNGFCGTYSDSGSGVEK